MDEIAFPEKPLQADISCSGFEKKSSQSRKYFVRKNFSTGTCRNGLIRLRKKLETESLFRKSPSRPIYRTPNSNKKSQSCKYFVRKNFSTYACRKGHPRSKNKLLTKLLFRKSPSRPIYRAENAKKYYHSRKYFVRKNFSTFTCRKDPP